LEVFIPESLTLTVSLRGTREVKDNYQLFRLAGLMDAFSEPTFRKTFNKHVEEGPANVILDLSQVDFIDSSGLGALVQLLKKVQSSGGKLQIVPSPRVTQSAKIARLDQFLPFQSSLDVAEENIKKS
jgi:anti-anti-sigma factor